MGLGPGRGGGGAGWGGGAGGGGAGWGGGAGRGGGRQDGRDASDGSAGRNGLGGPPAEGLPVPCGSPSRQPYCVRRCLFRAAQRQPLRRAATPSPREPGP